MAWVYLSAPRCTSGCAGNGRGAVRTAQEGGDILHSRQHLASADFARNGWAPESHAVSSLAAAPPCAGRPAGSHGELHDGRHDVAAAGLERLDGAAARHAGLRHHQLNVLGLHAALVHLLAVVLLGCAVAAARAPRAGEALCWFARVRAGRGCGARPPGSSRPSTLDWAICRAGTVCHPAPSTRLAPAAAAGAVGAAISGAMNCWAICDWAWGVGGWVRARARERGCQSSTPWAT